MDDSEDDLVDDSEDENEVYDVHDEPLDAVPEYEDVDYVPVNVGLDDFEHLTQFMDTGRCVCTNAELQLVKFVVMAQGGYGVSRHFSEGMLAYCKASGGKNVHLPDVWKACVEQTTGLIEKLEGSRKTFKLDVPIPDNVRELLADPKQTHIEFQFECPITEMIRVAMFSATCQNLKNVAFSYEDNGGFLDDFCNGERYKRIADAMPHGGAILGAILATDGICLDKCMFDSQEVG
jgi:hypothetical protein